MNERYLPVFVYGTLLPGEPNSGVLARRVTADAPAYLPDTRLWIGPDYPILERHRGALGVRGHLLELDRAIYSQALAELDDIEGYWGEGRSDNLYLRTVATVTVDAGPGSPWYGSHHVPAWVYVGAEETLAGIAAEMQISRTGDWLADRRHLYGGGRR